MFIKKSTFKSWIYFIQFTENIYAWGTASKDAKRIRKTSLFNSKLTGKYDRRGEYLMLKEIYGMPKVILFECEHAFEIEQQRRSVIYKSNRLGACFRGFTSNDRKGITLEIYESFKMIEKFKELTNDEKKLFDEFIHQYYLGKLRHPTRNASFYFGDCLEPNFLDKTLKRDDLIPVIEKALSVRF